MSQYVIVFEDSKTGLAKILIPSPNWLAANNNNYKALAEKDLPAGHTYKIVNRKSLPTSRDYRLAWRYSDLKECPKCYKKNLKKLAYIKLKGNSADIINRIQSKTTLQELKEIESEITQ